MVQAMESWFLSDHAALRSFYGNGFNDGALPNNPDIEDVPKQDALDGLNRATRNTSKRSYNKGKHSFEILAMLDPERVSSASRHADTLIQTLRGLS